MRRSSLSIGERFRGRSRAPEKPARTIPGGSRARAGTRTALEPRITGCEPDRQMESTADPRRDDEPVGAERTPADRSSRAAAANPTIEILGYAVSWRAAAAAVLTLAAVMFFARLGARALWSSEFRWAEIAREMHLTGRYFWPTINGRVYYDKPLGSYWLVMAATWLTGGLDETSARLPCAIAGVLGVWLVMLVGRRLYGDRVALLAGLILATSFSFVFFSRHASADVETVTGELAAFALFLRNERRQNGWWVVGLWLVMAATSLTKGLLGYVLPLMVLGVYSCLADGWAELGRRLSRGPVLAPNRMAHRAQSMAVQLEIPGRDTAWRGGLLCAVCDFRRAHRFREGPGDGLSRKRRAFFPSVRPSRTHLSLLLRDLRPDDAVVGIPARGAGGGSSEARCGPARRCRPRSRRLARPSFRTGLFLGDLHLLHAFRIAPKLLPAADPARRGTVGRANCWRPRPRRCHCWRAACSALATR